MQDTEEENHVSINLGFKSIPIQQLEKCIATAIAKEIKGSKLSCHVTSFDITAFDEIKLKIELSDDYDDVGF